MRAELLKDVSTIVVHANCADGTASALILRACYPEAKVIEVGYDASRDRLCAAPGMLFCDMTPPAARVQEFVEAGAIVLDHHKSAREIVQAFGERGVFGDELSEPGVSGAVLALLEVWDELSKPPESTSRCTMFASLAGIYDTWQRQEGSFEQSCIQAEFLLFLGMSACLELGLGRVLRMLDEWLPRHVWNRIKESATKAAKEACKVQMQHGTLAIVEGRTLINYVADLVTDADVVAGFSYGAVPGAIDEQILKVSLRSRGEVDVAKIAAFHGGGGHSGAAGFSLAVCEPYNDDPYCIAINHANPYTAIAAAVSRAMRRP